MIDKEFTIMHPILAEQHLQILSRRRQELITNVERSALVTMPHATQPEPNQLPHRGLLESLIASIGAGQIVRRWTSVVRPGITTSL